MIVKHADKTSNFVSAFNTATGEYARTGINGTDEDSFMSEYPQLLDIGIVGHCDHARFCTVGCYQGGVNNEKPNMLLSDYASIMEQSIGKGLFQVALGGHGDPNKHEDFDKILQLTRQAGVVPNYTTSGYGITGTEVALTKEHCGAVAVSMYSAPYTWTTLERFTNAKCKTNVHWVIGKDSIALATKFLNLIADGKILNDPMITSLRKVNAIVFLLYKPVGCGKPENVLDPVGDGEAIKKFFDAVYRAGEHIKIGFDSCTVPALLKYGVSERERAFLDTCEGARYSAYITPDMQMTPCSFANMDASYYVPLDSEGKTVQSAWNSPVFERFRSSLKNAKGACSSCSDWKECRGGCPLMQQIVPCADKREGLK